MGQLIAQMMLATVLFIVGLFFFTHRNDAEKAAIAGVQYRASKKAMLDLAAVLEQDLRNLGSNYPNYYSLAPENAITGWDTSSTTRYFEFIAQTRPGAVPDTVRYQWRAVDSVDVDGDVKPVLTLNRFVDGRPAGTSGALLTRVKIALGRADGSPPFALEDTRLIAVELEGFSTIGRDRMIKLTRWNGVYRPIAVTRDDFDDI